MVLDDSRAIDLAKEFSLQTSSPVLDQAAERGDSLAHLDSEVKQRERVRIHRAGSYLRIKWAAGASYSPNILGRVRE